jgi:hypothetical protein
MRKFLARFARFLYRNLVKNKFVRLFLLLSLSVWGISAAVDRFLSLKKPNEAQVVFNLMPENVGMFSFTHFSNGVEEELSFSKTDSFWILTEGKLTLRLPTDSVASYLKFFSKIESKGLAEMPQAEQSLPFSTLSVVDFNGKKSVFKRTADKLADDTKPVWYTIDSAQLAIFDRDFSSFRSRRFFDLGQTEVVTLRISYPSDSLVPQTILYRKKQKGDIQWQTTTVGYGVRPSFLQDYLRTLPVFMGEKFIDKSRNFSELRNLESQLVFFKTNTDSVVFSAFRLNKGFALNSSQLPEQFFQSDTLPAIFTKPSVFLWRKLPPKKRR